MRAFTFGYVCILHRLTLKIEYFVGSWLFGKVELSSLRVGLRILEICCHKMYKVFKYFD
jgi:hypothetical protein